MTLSSEQRLIIFYGSSPGSGKSTLSSWLSRQLKLAGCNCLWIYEDDILAFAEFKPFIQAINTADVAMMNQLLLATERFSARRDKDEIIVTDSIFPCFNWLLASGLYSPDELVEFSENLLTILQPLSPIVFFLNISPDRAIKRAVKQRGDDWLKQLIQTVNSYSCNLNRAIETQQDVEAFFESLAKRSLDLLDNWESVILDAETHSINDLKQVIQTHLQINEEKKENTQVLNPAAFTGVYCSEDAKLNIYRSGDHLYIDTYWPKGCQLVPECSTCFTLKDTSSYLEFKDMHYGRLQTMLYYSPTGTTRYQRVN